MIDYVERDLTEAELALVNAGFIAHADEFGNPATPSLRHGVVALDANRFVGCATGLAHDSRRWFYLTDLYVEKPYRGRGIGSALLSTLERRVVALGSERIWTWTAGFEAPAFYKKQGYDVFCEMAGWYVSGHSRIGLWKTLAEGPNAPDDSDDVDAARSAPSG